MCKQHEEAYRAELERRLEAVQASTHVELFSKRYRGRVPPPKLGLRLVTLFFDDRELAEANLRILAAQQGCTVVTGVELVRETAQSGNYVHGVWQAKGTV